MNHKIEEVEDKLKLLPKPFKPKIYETYFYHKDNGTVKSTKFSYHTTCMGRLGNGNTFRTHEDAMMWSDFIRWLRSQDKPSLEELEEEAKRNCGNRDHRLVFLNLAKSHGYL